MDSVVCGPVAAMIKVQNADEAVRIANHSPFGLGSSLWTANLAVARDLERYVNDVARQLKPSDQLFSQIRREPA